MSLDMLKRVMVERGVAPLLGIFLLTAGAGLSPIDGTAQQRPVVGDMNDPRAGLAPGVADAGVAAEYLELLAHRGKPDGFFTPGDPGDGNYSNTDLAFSGDLAIMGSYNGFTVYDISDPADPQLRVSVVCPGGQGDVSVVGNLVFVSVQETRARVDCGTEGAPGEVNPERFRGVRIFDIANLDNPTQVAAVQTCRGSHTHTVVSDPDDTENLYVYVSGTSVPRPDGELAGCTGPDSQDHPETSYFQIEVIRVPLDAPEEAQVINEPRIFADEETGDIRGLWAGGDHGFGTQTTRITAQCHDITAFPEIGLAAGACSGNGILLDISDPANPVRIDAVEDPGFAFWHSATFNNDGTKVIFTDEWGGGSAPRCLASDSPEWGANAIFDVVDGEMRFASYYKMPAPQTEWENCVAHNGSLIPVPGRDIKVQAWYQGGISVFDFTDSANPVEIAYFDRGPISGSELMTGGYWSAYWYNGHIYGSEIVRGFDVLALTPSEHLSQNEIDAAKLVRFEEYNPQHQPSKSWPPEMVVARALLDQAVRHAAISAQDAARVTAEMDRAESLSDGQEKRRALAELATTLWTEARVLDSTGRPDDAERLRAVAGALLDVAGAQR